MIRVYNSKDYDAIKIWFKGRNQPCPKPEMLSSTGFIVENIAAGFLYTTNSSLCWIENLVGNPFVAKEFRNVALEEIVEALIKEAKGKAIVCFSSVPAIFKRAQNHGFQIHEKQYTLMTKEA